MKLFSVPTSDEWLFFSVIFFLVIMLIAVAEFLRKLLNGNSEITRKAIHIVTGILMAFAPYVFSSAIPPIIIAMVAITGTFFSMRFGLLESLHDMERLSYGTIIHPLSFLILVLFFWDLSPQILSISILVLAIPDALAAIVGKHIRSPHYFAFSATQKTVEGSAAMFGSTVILILTFFWYFKIESETAWVIVAVTTALVVTAWEAACSKGWDNLAIPLSAAFMLHYFIYPSQHQMHEGMISAVILAAGIALISYYFKLLSDSGSIAVFLLASIIYGVGGWTWTIPILTFFISSSVLSKFGKNQKMKLKDAFDKTDKRDAGQVAANGGVAGCLVLLWYLFPDWTDLYLFYVASIAAVTADTWGTEIGTMMKGRPRSIISLKSVEIGTSGGVSFAGIAGGIIGASLIVLSAYAASGSIMSEQNILKLVTCGLIGSLIDSILGATLQSQYRTIDGALTEKTVVNAIPTTLVRGFVWLNNDKVNWICASSGAVSMYFLL